MKYTYPTMAMCMVFLFFTILRSPVVQGAEFDRWQYIQVDDQRGKWGDDHEPSYMKYVGLAMGDVTGDGRSDIVSGRYIYQNPGGDLTAPWPRITFEKNIDAILIHDIDGDDLPDIIAQSYPDVYWLEAADNNGRQWTMTAIGEAPKTPHGNGQGHAFADIVAGGREELALSTGEGIFYWEIPENPETPWKRVLVSAKADEQGLACGDLDGDGDIDVTAVLKDDHLTMLWFENPGDGTSAWKDHKLGMVENEGKGRWWGGDRIGIADLDGDGKNDIVVTEEDPGDRGETANVWWFKPGENPKQEWTRIHLLDSYSCNNLDLADMDNDGDIDVITQEHKGPHLRLFILENRDNGTEWGVHIVDGGKEGHNSAKTADLDGDGDLEIVSMAWDAHPYLHLWRNDN